MLIINTFHSVPGVPRVKVERLPARIHKPVLRRNAIGDRL